MITRFGTVLGVSAALALAGCGGSSQPGSTPAGASATAGKSFVAQLNTVCNRANAAYSATSTSKAGGEVIAHYLTVFHALRPPANLQSTYTQYLSVLGQELVAIRQGKLAEVQTLAQNRARPLARRLGATNCANPK